MNIHFTERTLEPPREPADWRLLAEVLPELGEDKKGPGALQRTRPGNKARDL